MKELFIAKVVFNTWSVALTKPPVRWQTPGIAAELELRVQDIAGINFFGMS